MPTDALAKSKTKVKVTKKLSAKKNKMKRTKKYASKRHKKYDVKKIRIISGLKLPDKIEPVVYVDPTANRDKFKTDELVTLEKIVVKDNGVIKREISSISEVTNDLDRFNNEDTLAE